MSRIPQALMLYAALSLIAACSKSDREQAAKPDDGVATFRYQPPDTTKYTQKKKPLPEKPEGNATAKSAEAEAEAEAEAASSNSNITGK